MTHEKQERIQGQGGAKLPIRYFDSQWVEFDSDERLAAWFIRDNHVKIRIGDYMVKWVRSEGSWQLFVSDGLDAAREEKWRYIESITLLSEAIATARKNARAALRKAGREP